MRIPVPATPFVVLQQGSSIQILQDSCPVSRVLFWGRRAANGGAHVAFRTLERAWNVRDLAFPRREVRPVLLACRQIVSCDGACAVSASVGAAAIIKPLGSLASSGAWA